MGTHGVGHGDTESGEWSGSCGHRESGMRTHGWDIGTQGVGHGDTWDGAWGQGLEEGRHRSGAWGKGVGYGTQG